jgi:hypothetical protein
MYGTLFIVGIFTIARIYWQPIYRQFIFDFATIYVVTSRDHQHYLVDDYTTSARGRTGQIRNIFVKVITRGW